ncbi:MAG TPA: FG-GAP-like repeat-containing protein [Thermoanaerobaculia bacterium]
MTLSSVQERTETSVVVAAVHGLQTIDYDNDGILDLIGLIDQSNSGGSAALYAWHGLGDGTFDVPVSLDVSSVSDLLVTDVNNDGKKDLVMATWDGRLVVKLGNGSGFDAPKTKTLDHYELHISSVLFDGDGYTDIVGAAGPYGFFVVYHGNGDGTFTEVKRVSTDIGPVAIAAADFDGDGRADVAYGDLYYTGTIEIAFQNADGTFARPVVLQSGKATTEGGLRDFPSSLTVGDVDENGKQDLIATNWQEAGPTDSIVLFRNNGSRSFARSVLAPRMPDAGGAFQMVRLLDVDGDGHLDIVSASLNGGKILTYIGNGDGTFLSPTYYDGDFFSIVLGKFASDDSMRLAGGTYQKLIAAKYSCAAQVYLYSAATVISTGQSAPLRALVGGIDSHTAVPRGTVTFREAATTLGTADVDATGYAAFDAPGLATGAHTITADFSGNAILSAATSNTISELVTTETTTTTLAIPSSFVYGTNVTVHVSISSSRAGSIPGYYYLTVDGVTNKYWSADPVILKLNAGVHTIEADYLGDHTFPPSSTSQQVTVAKDTVAITAPSASVLTVRSGTAHVLPFVIQGPVSYAGPTGSLTMTEKGAVIASGTVSNGGGVQDQGTATLSATLQRGAHDVIVSYSGDGNFNAASVSLTLDVLQNVPFTIEARGLQNAISIRAVLPANTTSATLYRSPSGANSWTLVNGWTPDVELDASVSTRGVLYDYRLTVIASGVTQTSNVDSAMLFTDDPVTSGTTAVKRTHFDELRMAINAQRAVAGLAPFNFDATYSGTLIRASHLASMRTALTEARHALGMAAPVFTDSASASTPIRAVHIRELRDQSR